MKDLMRNLLFGMLMISGMPLAHAGLFGYSSIVEVQCDGAVDLLRLSVEAPTYDACVMATNELLAYQGRDCDATASECKANRPAWIDELPIRRIPPLIIRPECIQCPPYQIDRDHLELIYPELSGKVLDLAQRYQVAEYNRRIIELQQEFDIAGFEKAILNLEQTIHKLDAGKAAGQLRR